MNIVQLFIENGADPNIEDKYAQTCLYYAIREGHEEIVDYLTSCPNFTKIDKADKKNLTPYLFALKHGRTKIAELLVNKGANTQIKSNDKKSKNKKAKVEEEKVEEDVQKPKKYVLCRINENGEKTPLTVEEIETFQKEFPELYNLLRSPTALDELEQKAPEEYKKRK